MAARKAVIRIPGIALLFLLSASITLVQDRVGTATVYSPAFAARREMLHESVLANRLPEGARSWREIGANGVNTRIAVVYLAEGLHQLTGLNIGAVYRTIDSVALFAALVALFFYFGASLPSEYALIGVMYVGATLPLTAFFAYFHPWDRVSLLAWVCLLLLLRADRLWMFAGLLALSVTVKFDTILLPGLYWLVRVTYQNWVTVSLRTVALFALTFGTWFLLQYALPGGLAPVDPLVQIRRNIVDFMASPLTYPPLLGFPLPVLLAIVGLRREPRFTQMSAVFGLLLLLVFAVLTNFLEYRAELPALILILPAALATLHRSLAVPASPVERPVLSSRADFVGQRRA